MHPAKRKLNAVPHTCRPTRREDVSMARVGGRSVAYDPVARQLYVVRDDAAALWSALGDGVDYETLLRELQETAQLPRETADELLRGMLEPLVTAGLVTLEAADGEQEG